MSAFVSPAPYTPAPASTPAEKGFSMLLGILRRIRRTSAAPVPERPYATPHACSVVVDGLPPLDSPLITELIALQAHTRHLGWLSTREQRPDE